MVDHRTTVRVDHQIDEKEALIGSDVQSAVLVKDLNPLRHLSCQ